MDLAGLPSAGDGIFQFLVLSCLNIIHHLLDADFEQMIMVSPSPFCSSLPAISTL